MNPLRWPYLPCRNASRPSISGATGSRTQALRVKAECATVTLQPRGFAIFGVVAFGSVAHFRNCWYLKLEALVESFHQGL